MTIRLGLVDCDTSHCVAFTQRLNHLDVDEAQWVAGAEVVAAYPGTSAMSPERIPGFTQQLRDYGITIVEAATDLIGQVDAVLIHSLQGSVHVERAQPFLEAGIPLFVDKPLASSVADARTLLAEAQRRKLLLWSSSSLRFAPEVQDIQARADEIGPVTGVSAHGPASQHPGNPGLFHYAVHTVHLMYQLMGLGCETVRLASNADTDVAVGRWSDGRFGVVRGLRRGATPFGVTVFGEKKVATTAVGTTDIYSALLRRVVAAFESGKAPLEPADMLEAVAFQEAALQSMDQGGAEVRLATAA
ncbi:MAG: oxidoreductase [Dehalococcoidia bacterium]|nr:oxidoreductase [Dehalococcoidia bacterium]